MCNTWVNSRWTKCTNNMRRNYDIKNSLIKRPTYENKKNFTKMSCSIGEFHNVHYILKNQKRSFFADNDAVMKERDRAGALKA